MIGLFLGSTNLSSHILKTIKKINKKYFIIDLTKNNLFKRDKSSHFINIGKFGEILNLINKKKCKKVLFAGKIDKPKISKLRMDFKGLYYLPRIIKAFKLGDAAILKELIKILSENKIDVIKLNYFNPELTLKKGIYTKQRPSKNNIIEIKNGINYLNKLSPHNHTQAIVIVDNKIVKKETSSGTKKMIKKLRKNKMQKGILIKFPKKKQDLRADLPTIGYDTLKDCKKVNLKGLVLKSDQNIFLDQKKSINYANKNKIFIQVI
mgnify:FL=1